MKIKPTRRRGYALMLVMLEMSLIAALWGIAYRQLMATMMVLTQLSPTGTPEVSAYDEYKPLARALSLLETGDPPDGGSGVYTCNSTIYLSQGAAYYTITFLKGTGGTNPDGSSFETWTVQSVKQPAPDSAHEANWDTTPPTFGH